ncbi:MAG: hypothetical protein J4F36_14015 [Nitrosopumilaceae archaeon]|nr:hypothetical protein [Nitrosopumilaceae archaeon]
MTVHNKNDVVLLLIKKATENKKIEIPGIIGKKALQKSMYFFNESFNLFTFKWRDYGPLSGELQQIASDFIDNGKVIVKDIPTQKSGIYTRNLTFNYDYNSYFSNIEFTEEINEKMDKIIQFISGKSPRELELLASVHYWAKRQTAMLDEYTVEYIHEKLTELKPDAGFTSKDVENAVNTLQFQDYLN